MSGFQGDPPHDPKESTQIDLGDDLIEKTDLRVVPESPSSVFPPDLEDQFQSAKILMSEGLWEESKKVLRKILVADPSHVPSRQLLSEIHDLELKQLVSSEEERSPIRYRRREEREGRSGSGAGSTSAEVEQVIRDLDRDLKLGLLETAKDQENSRSYTAWMDEELSDLSPQDRIDIGIAFLEMGLVDIAVQQFRGALSRMPFDSEAEGRLSATALLAYALILEGRPLDAVMELEPLLRDTSIRNEEKIEFMYLMGRAYESLRKPDLAMLWFDQVRAIDPAYRDVQVRRRRGH